MPKQPPVPDLAAELAPEEQSALGDLRLVERRLAGYVAPRPSPEETEALLMRLRPLVAARAAVEPAVAEPAPEPRGWRQWLNLAWSQTSVMEPAFWWASAAVFAIGLLLSALDEGRSFGLILALASPVIAAAGVAYAFHSSAGSLREMELSCPIRPLELLYARLGLVLLFNLGLSFLLVVVLWAEEPRLVFWRLAVGWLGPMLGLAGAALYSTVRWGSIVGVAVPLGAWAAYTLAVWQQTAPDLAASERLIAFLQADVTLVGAAVALVAGVLLLRAGGRLVAGESSWS